MAPRVHSTPAFRGPAQGLSFLAEHEIVRVPGRETRAGDRLYVAFVRSLVRVFSSRLFPFVSCFVVVSCFCCLFFASSFLGLGDFGVFSSSFRKDLTCNIIILKSINVLIEFK